MQVTKIASGDVSYNDINKPTDEEMKNEYKYYLAEQMTKKLLEKGLISKVEFDKIMEKNQASFSPLLSKIMA